MRLEPKAPLVFQVHRACKESPVRLVLRVHRGKQAREGCTATWGLRVRLEHRESAGRKALQELTANPESTANPVQ